VRRGLTTPLAALLLAGAALPGQEPPATTRWLPGRPEAFATFLPGGVEVYTVRGRHRTVAEFLDALVAVAPRVVRWDARARVAASETVVTVDLHERPADELVELLAAAAGLDITREGGAISIASPPLSDGEGGTEARRRSALRFYLRALAEHPDEDTAARAHRGLAEIHSLSGNHAEAAVEFDLLLRLYRGSRHAVGASILLARSLRGIGDRDRARRILFASLDSEEDPQRREWALRWLLSYLVEDRDYEGVTRLTEVFPPPEDPAPETLLAYLGAGASLVRTDQAHAAVSLLGALWERSPAKAAVLAPVLAEAYLDLEDTASALRVMRVYAARYRIVPTSAPVLLAFSDLAMRLGDRTAALLCAEGVVRASDVDPETKRRARTVAADLLVELGLEKRALGHLREIARGASPPESEVADLRAAEIILGLGKPEEARLLFQTLTESPRVEHEARLGVVKSLFTSGSMSRTREAAREMLEAGPPDALAAEALHFAVRSLEMERDFERARRLAAGDLSVLEEVRR